MTMTSSAGKVVYKPDGVVTVFSVPFRFFAAADLVIERVDGITVTPVTSGFTVTGAGSPNGGSVTFAGAPVGAASLVIRRATPHTQETDYPEGGRFPSVTVETDFDRVVAQLQELQDGVDRSIKAPVDGSVSSDQYAKDLYAARDKAIEQAGLAVEARIGAEAARDAAQEAEAGAEAALAETIAVRDTAVAEVQAEGENQRAMIVAEGTARLQAILDAGEIQTNRVNAAGSAQRQAIIQEGAEQRQSVAAAGSVAALESKGYAKDAAASAELAAQYARNAEAVAGVGLASSTGKKPGIMWPNETLMYNEDTGELGVNIPTMVSTPAVSFPSVVGIGFPYILTMSASTVNPGEQVAEFRISVDGGALINVPAVNGAAEYSVIPQGGTGLVKGITVQAMDTAGNLSLKARFTYIQNTVVMVPPSVLSPADGAIGVALKTIITLAPASILGVSSTPEHTQVVVSAVTVNADGTETEQESWNSGETLVYCTSLELPVQLKPKGIYKARARHKFAMYGWSDYGEVSRFEAMGAYISAPGLSGVANGATGVALKPTIQVGAFLVTPARYDTPKGTNNFWYRFETAAGVLIEEGYKTFAAAGGSLAPAANLPIETGVVFRGRWSGNVLTGAEARISFETVNAYVQTPTIISPTSTDKLGDGRITITTSAFSGIANAHTATRYVVEQETNNVWSTVVDERRTAEKLSFSPSLSLSLGETYRLSVYHEGNVTGYSEQSSYIEITTQAANIGQVWEITQSSNWTPPILGAEYGVLLWGAGGNGAVVHNSISGGGGGGGGFVITKIVRISQPISITLGSTGSTSSSINTLGMTAMGGAGGSECSGGNGGSGGGGGRTSQNTYGGGGGAGGGGGGAGGGPGAYNNANGGNGFGGKGGIYNGTGGGGVYAGACATNNGGLGAGGGFGAGGGGGSSDTSLYGTGGGGGGMAGAGSQGSPTGGKGGGGVLNAYGTIGKGGDGGVYSGAQKAGRGATGGRIVSSSLCYSAEFTLIATAGGLSVGNGGDGSSVGSKCGGGGGGGYGHGGSFNSDGQAIAAGFGAGGAGNGNPGGMGICVVVLMKY